VLTKRERSVLRLVVDGQTNRSIGTSLDIAVKTVETHRSAIMRKLNLSSVAALVRYAVRNNIVQS
jgi:DNA-binding NarL/FixJ family response regulator